MLDNWDLVQDFLAIYRQGSVTKAAKALGVQQSTTSRRLSQLEDELGVQLFFRLQGGVQPTDAALALVRDAEQIEDSMAKLGLAAQGKREEVAGLVRVTAPLGISLRVFLPMCESLYKQHPSLRVSIIAGLHTLDLARGEADLALRFVKPSSGDLIAKPMADLEFAVLAHKDYRKNNRSKNPDKLDWIGIDSAIGKFPEYTWMQKNISVSPRLVCNDYTVQFEAVRQGLGVAILPLAMRLNHPDLVEVKLGLPMPPAIRLWVVMHRSLRHVGKYAAVWNYLLSHQRLL